MHILFLSERLPWPLHDGGNIRTFHLLRALASRHRITLVSHSRTGVEEVPQQLSELADVHLLRRPNPSARAASWAFSPSRWKQSWFLAKNWSETIRQCVQSVISENACDLVYCNQLDTVCYLGSWPELPAIFDSHNCLYRMAEERANNGLSGWLFRREAARLLQAEHVASQQATRTLVCSERDRRLFLAANPQAQIETIPNGVDTRFFDSSQRAADENEEFVFIGTLDYRPNVTAMLEFCGKVWPRFRDEFPKARMTVVGARPTRGVRALAEIPGVSVEGSVSDVRPYLWRATATVIPLKSGGGTRLKILEAMAAGCPVISSTKGAEGIEYEQDQNIIIADEPLALFQAMRRMLMFPGVSQDLSNAGRKLALLYDWEPIGTCLLNVVEEVGKLHVNDRV